MAKTVRQINNWRIREKHSNLSIPYESRYCIYSPDNECVRDNLTWDEALVFCQNQLTFKHKAFSRRRRE